MRAKNSCVPRFGAHYQGIGRSYRFFIFQFPDSLQSHKNFDTFLFFPTCQPPNYTDPVPQPTKLQQITQPAIAIRQKLAINFMAHYYST